MLKKRSDYINALWNTCSFVYICRWRSFFLLGGSINAEICLLRFTWRWRMRRCVWAQLPPVKATSTWMPSWKPSGQPGPKLWVWMSLSAAAVSYVVSRKPEFVFKKKNKKEWWKMLLQFMSHELNVAEFATGNQRLCSIWQCWLPILQVAAGFSFHTREQFQFISKFARRKKKEKKS